MLSTKLSLLVADSIGHWTIIGLKTEIDPSTIRVVFFPFIKKTFDRAEIKSSEVINYGFVGGWGIRIGTRYGTVYNVSGKMGLAIELKNGKKYCVGTQREIELRQVMDNHLST